MISTNMTVHDVLSREMKINTECPDGGVPHDDFIRATSALYSGMSLLDDVNPASITRCIAGVISGCGGDVEFLHALKHVVEAMGFPVGIERIQ